MSQPIFAVHNHHTPACGVPPEITDVPAGRRYLGYFENVYGEQMIFIYDHDEGIAILYSGDAGWATPYVVEDGRPRGLIMTQEEMAWLAACWSAAHGPAHDLPERG